MTNRTIRKRWQWSLRAFLAFSTIVAVVLGIWIKVVHNRLHGGSGIDGANNGWSRTVSSAAAHASSDVGNFEIRDS